MLFLGAVGKSAQLPLYLWLPDAMEGPTPVSALIHAATMVTAGVFLMVRVNPVLAYADRLGAHRRSRWIGVVTALFAATIAIAQNDIKRVLAYSTVSQLGYMFLAVGSGAYVAAIFHMVTHAFFKALLFLGSGSVIHGMHDEQDMRYMGALRKLMPITAVTFIIGWLAIAGVPPFAGFWSKDEILLFAFDKSPALWVVGLVTALLTAYYMTRQVMMVFFGEAQWNDHAERARRARRRPRRTRSPWIMLVPLVVLAGAGGRRRAARTCRSPRHRPSMLVATGLEPVVGRRRAQHRRAGPRTSSGCWWHRRGRCARRHRRPPTSCTEAPQVKAVEPPSWPTPGTTTRTVSDFMGGPGHDGFEGTAWFDANVIDGAVNGTGEARAGACRRAAQGAERSRAHLRRDHRPRCRGACSPGSSSGGAQ